MSTSVYLSRAFVEFGPFAPQEIVAFEKRGLLRPIDHIRHHGKDDWTPIATWLASIDAPSTPTVKSPPEEPAKKVPVKKAAAPAKKAAAKKPAVKKPKKD